MRSFLSLLLVLATPLATHAQDMTAGGQEGDPMAEPPVAPESPDAADEGLEQEPATGEATTETSTDGLVQPVSLETEDEVATDNFAHEDQIGLRVGVGLPFVFAVKYGEGPICSHNLGDDGRPETLCRRVGAPLLDLDLSFGITEGVELLALARIGLAGEEPTRNSRLVLGAGIRSYGSPRSQVKAYIGVLVIADLTAAAEMGDPTPRDWGPADIGAAGQFGLQIEAMRNLGFYVQLGAGLQMLRGLYLIGDIAGGLQVRIP